MCCFCSLFDIDASVQLVCKYLNAYKKRRNLKLGINKLYKEKDSGEFINTMIMYGVYMYVCIYVCMYVGRYVCCMFVCICMYVCMYAQRCISICACLCKSHPYLHHRIKFGKVSHFVPHNYSYIISKSNTCDKTKCHLVMVSTLYRS